MIETYLSERETLRGVVVIMDIRRTPHQEELNLLGWLAHYSIAGITVLTKTDKLSKNKQAKQHHLIAQTLERDKDDFILFSQNPPRQRPPLECDFVLS
jgi:GTP-binding protein